MLFTEGLKGSVVHLFVLVLKLCSPGLHGGYMEPLQSTNEAFYLRSHACYNNRPPFLRVSGGWSILEGESWVCKGSQSNYPSHWQQDLLLEEPQKMTLQLRPSARVKTQFIREILSRNILRRTTKPMQLTLSDICEDALQFSYRPRAPILISVWISTVHTFNGGGTHHTWNTGMQILEWFTGCRAGNIKLGPGSCRQVSLQAGFIHITLFAI